MAKTGKSLSAFLAALFLTICLLPVMGATAYAAPAKRYVRYDANGGENAPTRQIKKKDEPLQIAAARPTREGYTFVCWDTLKSGGGTLYYPGSEYRTDRDLKLYATRIYNQGAIDAVRANGASGVNKRWQTMMDDRVRDTHSYLQSMEVPFDEDFWTYDGDHAPAPGMFERPENNINCRCIVEVIRG